MIVLGKKKKDGCRKKRICILSIYIFGIMYTIYLNHLSTWNLVKKNTILALLEKMCIASTKTAVKVKNCSYDYMSTVAAINY